MGLTPGPLLRVLFLFALKIPPVVLITLLVMLTNLFVCVRGVGSGFFVLKVIESNCDVVPLVLFVPTGFMIDSLKYIGVQSPDFRSKFENQFYSYSLFLTMSRSLRPLFIFQKHDMVQTTRIHTSTF